MLRPLAGVFVLVSVLAARDGLARSAGVVALGCEGCHSGGKTPVVTLTADPTNPSVGQPFTLTVSVSQANGSAAGFYLTTAYPAPGSFKAIEAGTSASASGVTHTMPRVGSGGNTVFKAQWTATQATGVEFDVYGLSANSDRTNRGDGGGSAQLQLLVGCTGATYYIDQDGDGYGSTDPAYPSRKDCTPPPGYAALPGDCDDFRAQVNPGVAEQCDLKDNNCDGNVDENVVDQPYCEDKDGDGHGVTGGAMKMDCKPSAGFGDCGGDCDDNQASIFPGATEVCDGIDNNCDGQVDEGARMTCGVGLCSRYALGCSTRCTPGDPFTETCNGYDDDCDGVVDNGTGEALCGDPKQACVGGVCVDGAGVVGTPGSAGSTGALGSAGTAGQSPAPTGLSVSPAPGGCAAAGAGLPVERDARYGSAALLLYLLGFAGRRRARRAGRA